MKLTIETNLMFYNPSSGEVTGVGPPTMILAHKQDTGISYHTSDINGVSGRIEIKLGDAGEFNSFVERIQTPTLQLDCDSIEEYSEKELVNLCSVVKKLLWENGLLAYITAKDVTV